MHREKLGLHGNVVVCRRLCGREFKIPGRARNHDRRNGIGGRHFGLSPLRMPCPRRSRDGVQLGRNHRLAPGKRHLLRIRCRAGKFVSHVAFARRRDRSGNARFHGARHPKARRRGGRLRIPRQYAHDGPRRGRRQSLRRVRAVGQRRNPAQREIGHLGHGRLGEQRRDVREAHRQIIRQRTSLGHGRSRWRRHQLCRERGRRRDPPPRGHHVAYGRPRRD